MKIISDEIIFSGEKKKELSSCSFPGICMLNDGTLLASFRAGDKKGPYNEGEFAAMMRSTDRGKTWSEPTELFKNIEEGGKTLGTRLLYFAQLKGSHVIAVFNAIDAEMPGLPYYNENTEGLKDTYIMVSHSNDMGYTWGRPERINVKTFSGLPLPLTGEPFVLSNGTVGIQFEVNKPYYETKYWVHHSAVIYSYDDGYTWGDEVVITDAHDIYYWDQRISVIENGHIMDPFWVFDRMKGDYINIHCSESFDWGHTFSEPYDTGLSGQAGNIIKDKYGRFLMIYINRDSYPTIRIARSIDGVEWNDALTVFESENDIQRKVNGEMNDAWEEMGKFSVGHPYIKLMDDDVAWAYYYAGSDTHRTDFHVAKIQLY